MEVTHLIFDSLVDTDCPVLNSVKQELENIESEIYDPNSMKLDQHVLLRKFVALRQALLLYGGLLTAKEDVLFGIMSDGLSHDHQLNTSNVYIRDLYDRIRTMTFKIEIYQSLIVILEQTYLAMIPIHLATEGNKLNKAQTIMACVATISLPVQALSQIFGIQLHIPYQVDMSLPEVDTTPFWTVVAISTVFSLILLFLFRRYRWI
jgi:Mg2+ and Co2+ transporter CorA